MYTLKQILFEITGWDLVHNSNRGGNDFYPKSIRYLGWNWRKKEAVFNTGKYVQRIQFPDIKVVSRLKGSDKTKVKLGLDGDVKVGCTCADWLYGGFKYMGTQTDYSIEQEGRFPEVRNPKTEGSICKHLTYLLSRLPDYTKQITQDYVDSKKSGYKNVKHSNLKYNKKSGKVIMNESLNRAGINYPEISKGKYIGDEKVHYCEQNSYKYRKQLDVYCGYMTLDISLPDSIPHWFNVENGKVIEHTNLDLKHYKYDWDQQFKYYGIKVPKDYLITYEKMLTFRGDLHNGYKNVNI